MATTDLTMQPQKMAFSPPSPQGDRAAKALAALDAGHLKAAIAAQDLRNSGLNIEQASPVTEELGNYTAALNQAAKEPSPTKGGRG